MNGKPRTESVVTEADRAHLRTALAEACVHQGHDWQPHSPYARRCRRCWRVEVLPAKP